MTFTINKGKHRASPLYWLRWFPFLFAPKKIIRTVRFDFNCKYNLNDDDQFDVNKLFGVSFGWVHKESARFGWRYEPKVKKFYIYAYTYVNGIRDFIKLCECVANHYYTCHLSVHEDCYIFQVLDEKNALIVVEKVDKTHNKFFSLLLGPYFGGNNPAPHDMIIELKKV